MTSIHRPREVAALLLVLASTGCRGREMPLPGGTPVVLISIDTLRADHLPAYGYARVATPHLDRLRREAVLFRYAYAPTPMTLPSHVTMLTGLLPTTHGVRNNVGFRFRSELFPSLPGLLRARGYSTGATVSSFVLRAETGLAGGFDYYDDSIDPRPGAEFGEYQRPGDRTAAFARDWIDARRGVPFFLFFHIYEPHLPYDPPEPYRSRYADSPYDGEVAAADAIVGGVLDHLRAQGLYDRTLIILTSDHGEGLGDHGEQQHSILLYREAIQVPLLVKLPGGRRGGEAVAAPAQLADILPTVTGLLGLQTPAGVEGLPLFGAAAGRGSRRLYAETFYPRLQLGWSELRSLLDERWHYIQGPRPELYDLLADPGETHDLAGSAAAVASRLRQELDRAYPPRIPRPEAVAAETAERLAALGYVGGLRAPEADGPLLNPRDALPLLERFQAAVRLATARRHQEAAVALRSIVAESPGSIEAWAKLGEVSFEQGRYDEAAVALEEATQRSLAPSADLLVGLGYARLRLGRLDEAEAAGTRALGESALRAHELLARVALARGRRDEAERQVAAALARPEPQPSSLLLRAELLIQAGDIAGALASVEEAERRAARLRMGQVFNLEFLRADALARLGRVQEAEAAYRREISAYPGHLLAYTNLGVLYHLKREPGQLDRVIEEMVAANPGGPAFTAAERTYRTLGLIQRAARWRARAVSAR